MLFLMSLLPSGFNRRFVHSYVVIDILLSLNLTGRTGEGSADLEYLEGLEDGIVWAKARTVQLLRGLDFEEKDLERAGRELQYLVDLVQREKVFTLADRLEEED